MPEYKTYDPSTYIHPYWIGDTVYNETVMFMNEDEVPLLFKASKILSVRSSDLKAEFVEGVDYVLRDGKLLRLPSSTMPYMPKDVYYPENPAPNHVCHCSVPGHPYLLWGDDVKLFEHQVHVTYVHDDAWTGLLPQKQDAFARFCKKAAGGERTTVLFYGDSITTGACSSKFIGCEPYADVALVSTMIPHFRAAKYYGLQEQQEPVLSRLASEYPNVGLIPMTSMYRYALNHKRDYDMNANNINHPNDFAVRLYAQTTLSSLIGDRY